MGFNFEFVSYRGAPLSNADLDALVRERVPTIRIVRHVVSRTGAKALHYVAVFEERPTLSLDATASAEMHDLRCRAAREDTSLSDLVKAAWRMARTAEARGAPLLEDHPASEPRAPHASLLLAQELSRTTTTTWWVCRADRVHTGGFARFEHGALTETAGADDPYVVDDGYIEVPAAKWRAATGSRRDPTEAFVKFLDNEDAPPLFAVGNPESPIAFDPERHSWR
jgi:hypothetical protein